MMKVPFLDLNKLHQNIAKEIEAATAKVMQRSDFILGEEVRLFEKEFAGYCQAKFGVGVNSGTDALFLSLMALGIGPGDEVIIPAFTFIATANAVSYTGARPVFADIDEPTYNIDPGKIKAAVTKRTKAVIPVHLFGQCADMDAIMAIAKPRKLKVIEDACQAHGAVYTPSACPAGQPQVKKAGALADAGCFSFYPTKNLGGFGDGGMVITDDEKLYERLRLLRDCGRKSRYEHSAIGYNSRLDTLQAAGLRVKLKYLEQWNKMRRYNAQTYDKHLAGSLKITRPASTGCLGHVYHIYAVRVKNRQKVVEYLTEQGIGVMVNYPIPLHLQAAYRSLGYRKGDFPVAEKACQEVISLPMHPLLSEKQIKYVASVLKKITEE
jgi:dTDP-4-amino-4,6-dideoxygalactose transaminase